MTNAVSFHPTEETIITQDDDKNIDQISGGNFSTFNMRVHQLKAHLSDPTGNDVSFNITFAMAIPGIFTTTKANESFSTRNSSVDPLSNSNQYFHIEFNLFSKEISKDTNKTDVAFYGTFAKIYPDKSESKVIPTWSDGEDTWICWIQRFTFRLTTQYIQSLSTHKMQIKVWDTKDKCDRKVRFDKPRAPKSASRSKSTNDITSWIKRVVMMISHSFLNTASFLENSDRILPHQIISSSSIRKEAELAGSRIKSSKSNTTTKSSAPSPDSIFKDKETLLIYAEPKDDIDTNLGSYAQLETLIEKPSNRIKAESKLINSEKKKIEKASGRQNDLINTMRSESRKSTIIPLDLEKYNKTGRVSLDIRISELFLSDHTISRTAFSINSLEDMFCMISIENSLLSSEQKKELNPLTINIKKIDNLPKNSLDFNELNKRYLPIYCEYTFCDLEPHKTVERVHKKKVTLDDVSVILLGTLNKMKLQHQMLNSFFCIKLFDRVENPENDHVDNDNIELSDKNDADMGDINITSSKPTITNIAYNQYWGEAKIDLSDIVKKQLKYLEVMIPITPTSIQNINHDMKSYKKNQEDNFDSYLESGTTIKVSFKLAEPLTLPDVPSQDKYYNKIIIVNTNPNCDFIVKEIGKFIVKHNCEKLNFQSENLSEMQKFLYSSTRHFTENEELFSGIFIADRECEILIIQSLKEIIKILYEICSKALDKYQDRYSTNLKILFNESLISSENENFQILTMLPLYLSKDISFFVSQPLLYVRDMIPHECVEGICKIKELLNTDSMHIAIRNKLIPTSQMLESISQYLCSHVTNKNDEENNFVPMVMSQKVTHKVNRKDIKTAQFIERKPQKTPIKRSKTNLSLNYVYPKKDSEFIYSCQTKNSVSSAKQIIRSQLDPNRLYTYSENYLFSGSFDPVDIEEEYVAKERMEHSEPRWINKGQQSVIDDIKTINTLPESRIKELQTQWVENTLHKSFMEPTIPERDSLLYKFDLCIRPLNILNRDSTSIMPSYDKQRLFNKISKESDHELWKNKVCVSDIRFKCHRVLPETELIEKGILSSNQIAKLQGLRKDERVRNEKNDVNQIPGTYVHPSLQEMYRSFTIGPNNYRNLLVNYVPVIEHDKNFNSVYQSTKESFIFRNCKNKIENRIISPFSVYL